MTALTTEMQALLSAVEAGDDDGAERVVLRLQARDEAMLMQWAQTATGDLQWWALRGLGHCGTPVCVPLVVEMLEHQNAALKAVAALTLAHIERSFPGQSEALSAMVQHLGADDGWVRQTMADALALCGDAAVDILGQAMASEECVRVRAIYALAKIATRKAAPFLFHALQDDNPLVRTLAYEGLDAMGLIENVIVTGG